MTAFPRTRPRRLRRTPALRRVAAETSLEPRHLILPIFVREGIEVPHPIASMPGVMQHPIEDLPAVVREAVQAGIGGIMLFGIPARRDGEGSGATEASGILNRAITIAVAEAGDALVVQSDLCLDEFTDHGHCGVLGPRGDVDNDATLDRYCDMALAQARAGSPVLGLSGMMDGQVAAVRRALDAEGFVDTLLLAYSAKYASAFYGPFREATGSPLVGDRRSYQLSPQNGREGRREAELDVAEGADIVMVKPAGAYLDVVAAIAQQSPVPVWAYQVSGEYAMVEAAAARGWIDRRAAIIESLIGIRRAGADAILTYWALEVPSLLDEGSRR